MYPWHGTTPHPPNTAPGGGVGGGDTRGPTAGTAGAGAAGGVGGPGGAGGATGRLDSPSSSQQSSYQVPQLRWLPSMMNRSSAAANAAHGAAGIPHSHGHANTHTLPNISSSLRMGQAGGGGGGGGTAHPHHEQHPHSRHAQQHQQQHQVQQQQQQHHAQHPHHAQHQHHAHHPPPVSVVVERTQPESIESEESEQSDTGRDGGVGLADGEYGSSSPGENPRRPGSGTRGPGGRVSGAGNRGIDRVVLGEEDLASVTGMGDTPRKHGKRLTTTEEVSLFDICNRHAGEFGQRSSLCKWWMNVTAEFTRDQGHPYSWHSVRRKVELVTKQRVKFLEEQREKGGEDLSHPQWRASIDMWIPTWQRWEEAEARRIEKRDSRRPRKRKDRSWEVTGGVAPTTTASAAGTAGWGDVGSDSWRQTSSPVVESQSASSSRPTAPAASQSTVRLPPGFDNMFSSSQLPQTPVSRGRAGGSSAQDNGMMTAVLETLGKLNKHLDSVNPDSRSPIISSLASSAESQNRGALGGSSQNEGASNGDETISSTAINKLRDELRREMRSELEKERASIEEKLDSVQRTQEMILQMLRQEPA